MTISKSILIIKMGGDFMNNKRLQFTLIEMTIVIVILAILAAIVIPSVQDMKKDAITSMVNSNTRVLQMAVDKYSLDHNSKLPTTIEPTLEKPQVIDIELLHPKYLKSEIDYKKLKEQKYWVDAFGTVWGATVDSPDNLIKSDKGVEFAQREKAEGYKIYQVTKDSATSKANKSGLKEITSFKVNKKAERIFIEGNEGDYLISSIDEYGLESAPAGLNYLGYQQDWFSPLIGKEGTFEFKMESKNLMFWDEFQTLQDTPAGTSIEYFFSVKGENNSFTPETTDFYSLIPSKEIKVKVVMKGSNGKMPSLYDMRIFYHFEKKEKISWSKSFENLTPTSSLKGYTTDFTKPTVVTDEFVVPEKIKEINNTDSYSLSSPPQVTLLLKNEDGTVEPISSFEELTPGSTVQVKREYPQGMVFAGTPSVEYSNGGGTFNFNPETRVATLIGVEEKQPMEEEQQQEEFEEVNLDLYEIIDTQNFIASSGDGEATDWTYAEIEDVQPEGTKIVYTYKYSNSNQLGSWTGNYNSIEDVPNSKAVLLQAKLMVLKGKRGTITPPSISKVRLLHTEGESPAEPVDSISTNIGSAAVTIKPVTGKEAIYDGNDSTYANHSAGTYYYDLTGDATNRTVRILTSATNDFRGDIQLVDEFDKALETVNSISNSKGTRFYSYSNVTSTEMKLRIPEGTKRIKVTSTNTGSSGTFRIHDIKIMSDNPASLGTVTHSRTDHSINLMWTKQSPIDRILVYEKNSRVGIVSANSFNHDPLLSNTSHTYRLIPIHSNGAVGLDTYYTAATLTRAITWSGLSAAAFDHNVSTYNALSTKRTVTWDGNLTGKTVYIKAEQSGVYTGKISVRDSNNATISVFNGITGTFGSTFTITGAKELALKIPANAASIDFDVTYTSGSGYFRVFEVEDRTASNIAVSGLKASTTDSKVTLSWTNPTSTNFLDAVVLRGTSQRVRTTSTSYSETPLYSSTSYSYTVYPVAKNYAVGEPISITTTTKARSSGIKWSGISASVYDHNVSTYASLGKSTYNVTWTGDLIGKTVYIKVEENGDYTTNVYFTDVNGTKLLTTNGFGGNSKTTNYSITGLRELALQVPVGATKLVIDNSTSPTINSGYSRIYEIEERSAGDMNITNLSYTSTETSITLKWTNPTTTEFDKVLVFRGNSYRGVSTTGTFTESNFYSNSAYTYTLHPIAKNKFVGKPFTISTSTKARPSGVRYSGLSAQAFDYNATTYDSVSSTADYLTWTGSLTDKTLTITAEEYGTYSGSIKFYNSSGALVSVKNTANNVTSTNHNLTGKQTFKFVIPSTVVKIGFHSTVSGSGTGYYRVFEVQEN